MKLLIVESPGKIKKIRSFLGAGWNVLASVGHIRDLPKKEFGIQFANNKVLMNYVNSKEKATIIKNLKAAAGQSDEIYLGMDMDREGEAIAWHVGMILGKQNWGKIKRITFTEITRQAILSALSQPRRVDANLVNAQQARRAVDRLVGFKVSPLVWSARNAGSSAGRVQSVAVRLVVEREREIRNFKPREYWKIKVSLSASLDAENSNQKQSSAFWAELIELEGKTLVSTLEPGMEKKQAVISTKPAADLLAEVFKRGNWIVAGQTRKVQEKRPFPPYITSTLQQAASVRLKWGAKKTMQIAQALYEHGAITYMRTDSPAISDEALRMVRAYIGAQYPPEYLPARPHVYKAKGGNAQEAHECIRPTHIEHTAGTITGLDPDQIKLYQLIWTQFVACQMAAARYNVTTIDIKNGNGLFRARGRQVLFDGWTRLTGSAAQTTKEKEGGDADASDEAQNVLLPDVAPGSNLNLLDLKTSQHQTQPPSRYTEATLIRTLEKFGIGRPSTYAPIMENIKKRGYIKEQKRMFFAEQVGEALVDLLMRSFKDTWMEYKFTASMEDDLDKVADGKNNWNELVIKFNTDLEQIVGSLPVAPSSSRLADDQDGPSKPYSPRRKRKGKRTDQPSTKSCGVCDKCGASMLIREGKNGPFIACSAFPKCKNTKPLTESALSVAPGSSPPSATKAADTTLPVACDKCGKPMVSRKSKHGVFLGCSGYPECRNIMKSK